MKINLFKKGKNYENENYYFNQNIYWLIILIVFFILLILAFIFGFNSFKKINQEAILKTEDTSNLAAKERKNKIEKVLEYFNEKQKRSNEIINLPIKIIDPAS